MNILPPIIAVILGVLGIAVNRHFAGPKLFETIIIVVVLIVVVFWLLSFLGLLGSGLYIGRPDLD